MRTFRGRPPFRAESGVLKKASLGEGFEKGIAKDRE
jgi:hypothetical protein